MIDRTVNRYRNREVDNEWSRPILCSGSRAVDYELPHRRVSFFTATKEGGNWEGGKLGPNGLQSKAERVAKLGLNGPQHEGGNLTEL